MAKPFYLIWQEGTTVLEGYDGANWIDGQLTFPIVFPGITTTPLAPTTANCNALLKYLNL